MASKRPIRAFTTNTSLSLRSASSPRTAIVRTSRCAFFSTAPPRAPNSDTESGYQPRWQQTPPSMTAPFRIRPQARGGVFVVNKDPNRLDDAYVRMLGSGGHETLSDEVKWLAVTHKSFDHGRRGFNDRLAYLGRRIVELQTSQALLNSKQTYQWPKDADGIPLNDEFGRKPYLHPALNGLQGLTSEAESAVLSNKRLSQVAAQYCLHKVTRWTPKRADSLEGSGIDTVIVTSLYAIVGAIALERGGEAANKVVQDKILTPLGFVFSAET